MKIVREITSESDTNKESHSRDIEMQNSSWAQKDLWRRKQNPPLLSITAVTEGVYVHAAPPGAVT